jgi:hypothetical protein
MTNALEKVIADYEALTLDLLTDTIKQPDTG